MTSLERAEIRRLPKKYRPLGAWGYFWYTILFSVPLIGLVALIICSSSDKNVARRSFARSFWIFILATVILTAAIVALFLTGILSKEMIDNAVSAVSGLIK